MRQVSGVRSEGGLCFKASRYIIIHHPMRASAADRQICVILIMFIFGHAAMRFSQAQVKISGLSLRQS